ncbi:hypothetical protein BH09PAT1_BH09PAT1_7950 [soil metagenome]
MKVNAAFLQSLSKEKYLAYIHALPNFKEEKIQSYATLILTLLAICIFGIFAIAPTLSTIFQLRKTLADNTFLSQQLQTKISNMSSLQQEYANLSAQLPIIYAAVPQTPEAGNIAGKIRALASKSNLDLQQLRVTSIEVASNKKIPSALTPIFISLSLQGNPSDFDLFTKDLITLDRVITIDSINFSKFKTQQGFTNQLTLQAHAYYRL